MSGVAAAEPAGGAVAVCAIAAVASCGDCDRRGRKEEIAFGVHADASENELY